MRDSNVHEATMEPVATIVFTAHNRRDMALDAVALAKAQTVPVEIIVCDDASSDGLAEALAEAHPDVVYMRSEVARGPCYHRNRGIEAARCPVVFPLDDDSMLVSPETVAQSLNDFADPRVALVAMPFANIYTSERVLQRRSAKAPEISVNFAACAHVVRKDAVERVGGYPEAFFYMGEEGDLAIRLIETGYRVILGSSDAIHHLQPPFRRSYKADFFGRRNTLLFYFLNAPAIALPLRLAGAMVRGLVFGLKNKCLKAAWDGIISGLAACWKLRRSRRPVSRACFRAFMACKQADSMSLAEFELILDS